MKSTHALAIASWILPRFSVKLFQDIESVGQLSSFRELADLVEAPQLRDNQNVEQLTQWQELIESHELRLTYPGAEDYPAALSWHPDPPRVLTYVGDPIWNDDIGLAVIGSREPMSQSLRWMETYLARFLQKSGVCVISGGARGIDQKAHSLAIAHGCTSVALMPSGLLKPYPFSWKSMAQPFIARGGTLLSQFPPDSPMQKHNFHIRNRLIALMAEWVLVVEARRRGGSWLTARWAMDEGRNLAAVPVSPMDSRGRGCLDLIFDGASMIRDEKDLDSLWQRVQCTFDLSS